MKPSASAKRASKAVCASSPKPNLPCLAVLTRVGDGGLHGFGLSLPHCNVGQGMIWDAWFYTALLAELEARTLGADCALKRIEEALVLARSTIVAISPSPIFCALNCC